MPTAVIAEDEPHLAEYLRQRLAALWPELRIVAVAGDGIAAAQALQQRPDVAFLDIRMPGASGIEVAAQLRDGETRPHLVFVTAYDQYAVSAFESEAVDYLLKPVSDERLARTVERLKRALAANAPPPHVENLLQQLARHLPEPPRYLRWIRASRRSGGDDLVPCASGGCMVPKPMATKGCGHIGPCSH